MKADTAIILLENLSKHDRYITGLEQTALELGIKALRATEEQKVMM